MLALGRPYMAWGRRLDMLRRAGQSGARFVACDSRPSDGGRQLLHVDLSLLAVRVVDTGRTQMASAYKLPRVWYAVAEGETATTATKGTKGIY